MVIRRRQRRFSPRAARRKSNRGIPRQQLRDRIQSAALRLFRERGFDATSVDEIVAAAGVAKGTLFNFYPTKQALLASYYQTLDSFMADELRRLAPGSPRASLVKLFRAMERRLRAEGDLACVLFREVTEDPTLGATDFDSGLDDLRQYTSFFEECRAMGTIGQYVNPRVAAELVQDLWSSTVQRWFRAKRQFSLAGTLARKLEVVFAGLSRRTAVS
jgi:AcrR family transcriptional regulator